MAKEPSRAGVFFAAIFRVLLMTVLFAGLGMGLGLFVGIIGTVVYGAFRHTHPDISLAYRLVAFPSAALFGAGAFLYNVMTMVRRAVRHA